MSAREKRKRTGLSLKVKMEIIKRLEKGETAIELAKEYGLGRATLYDIKKNKAKLMEFVKRSESGLGNRKTLRAGDYPKMESALFAWYLQERKKKTPINGDMIKTKAVEFSKTLTNSDTGFRASVGWLDKFKRRFGIRLQGIPEKKTSDICKIPFEQLLQKKVDELDLSSDQVYYTNNSVLFWKMLLPKNTPASSQKDYTSENVNKELITFMPCANVSGMHKLDLMVIGKTKYPKALKNVCLPVYYTNQTRGCVTTRLLIQWFHDQFVPEVKKFMRKFNLPEKALLLLEHIFYHPGDSDVLVANLASSDGMIQMMFLPPDYSPLLEPMDLNVIEMVKAKYKKKLLVDIISQGGDIAKHLEKVNLKNVVFALARAWNSISANAIKASWKTLCPDITEAADDEYEEDIDFSVENLLEIFAERNYEISKEQLTDFLENDYQETQHNILTDEAIYYDEAFVAEDSLKSEEEEAEEEEEATQSKPRIKNYEALQCLNKCITWAEENGVSAQETMVLRNLREKVYKRELVDQNLIANIIKQE